MVSSPPGRRVAAHSPRQWHASAMPQPVGYSALPLTQYVTLRYWLITKCASYNVQLANLNVEYASFNVDVGIFNVDYGKANIDDQAYML